MRRSPVSGATGNERGSRNPEPSAKPRKRSPSDQRRDAARAARHTVEQIQVKAHKRHTAWIDGGQRNVVASLTTDLEDLFDDRRDDQAGTFAAPYGGRTMRLGK